MLRHPQSVSKSTTERKEALEQELRRRLATSLRLSVVLWDANCVATVATTQLQLTVNITESNG